ncbi:MAG TPA: tRNA (adenosine(37)-N6)-threonylcarbamoyltransferase complex ATPase subunit type 1 TsaE [Planctomycetaceae bacterium]|nr:tRNA (adenosine(37)-N6)-threonylcarbamoyltransferase complex ATPase subunit type 1 TsaE [Planctomycetaceae bacterium]
MNGPNVAPFSADWRLDTASEAETDLLGARLAHALEPGAVVALVGGLGAGKTRLVRAVAEALGAAREAIASPTFVLVHEYEARLPIYHFDVYRLREPADFLDLGADEYLASAGVCFIEWADRVESFLRVDHLRIEITAAGASSREFHFRSTGPKSARILARLKGEPPGQTP